MRTLFYVGRALRSIFDRGQANLAQPSRAVLERVLRWMRTPFNFGRALKSIFDPSQANLAQPSRGVLKRVLRWMLALLTPFHYKGLCCGYITLNENIYIIFIHICIRICVYIYVYIYAYICIQWVHHAEWGNIYIIFIYMYIYVYVYIYIYTYMHIYAYNGYITLNEEAIKSPFHATKKVKNGFSVE